MQKRLVVAIDTENVIDEILDVKEFKNGNGYVVTDSTGFSGLGETVSRAIGDYLQQCGDFDEWN